MHTLWLLIKKLFGDFSKKQINKIINPDIEMLRSIIKLKEEPIILSQKELDLMYHDFLKDAKILASRGGKFKSLCFFKGLKGEHKNFLDFQKQIVDFMKSKGFRQGMLPYIFYWD